MQNKPCGMRIVFDDFCAGCTEVDYEATLSKSNPYFENYDKILVLCKHHNLCRQLQSNFEKLQSER